jgi:hypothetical protein
MDGTGKTNRSIVEAELTAALALYNCVALGAGRSPGSNEKE